MSDNVWYDMYNKKCEEMYAASYTIGRLLGLLEAYGAAPMKERAKEIEREYEEKLKTLKEI
jgi:hypothetical protein